MAQGLQTGAATEILLPLALAIMMLGMGLGLTRDDFRRIAREPKAVALGLMAQVVVLPALAIVVGVAFHRFFGLTPVLLLGFLLLACCPGGTTSNLVTYLARADAALSVSLTSVNSLAAAVTTPLIFLVTTRLVFGSSLEVSVSFLEMALAVGVMVVLPIVIGMQLREYRPRFAIKAEPRFRLASSIFLGLIIALVIYQNRADFWRLAGLTFPASIALNAACLGAGLLVGSLGRLHRKQSRALAIEVAFQNGTLGIAIAVGQLGSAEVAIVPGFYSLVMFATGGAVAWYWARDEARRGESDEAPVPA